MPWSACLPQNQAEPPACPHEKQLAHWLHAPFSSDKTDVCLVFREPSNPFQVCWVRLEEESSVRAHDRGGQVPPNPAGLVVLGWPKSSSMCFSNMLQKTQMNFLANPIMTIPGLNLKSPGRESGLVWRLRQDPCKEVCPSWGWRLSKESGWWSLGGRLGRLERKEPKWIQWGVRESGLRAETRLVCLKRKEWFESGIVDEPLLAKPCRSG